MLDEVVVTGYGDFKKATYTGSASVLTTEKAGGLPVVSVGQMIESNIPGISVVAGTLRSPVRKQLYGYGSCFRMLLPNLCMYWTEYLSHLMTSNFTSMSEVGGMGFIETLNPADIERYHRFERCGICFIVWCERC